MVCIRLKIRPSLLKIFKINIVEVKINADWGGGGGRFVFEKMAYVSILGFRNPLDTLSLYANFKSI